MSAATLQALDAALYTALGNLVHTGTASAERPFARAVRGWAPVDGSLLTLAPQSPAVILVWGRTKPQLVQASDTILGTPQPESRSPETWTIYIAHGETRDVDVALQGTTDAPGMLPLVDAVLGAVQGLAAAGTWQGRRVRVVDYGPNGALSQRGSVYVADVVVVAERTTPHVTDAAPDGATPLDEIQGDNGPPDDLFDHGTADTSP